MFILNFYLILQFEFIVRVSVIPTLIVALVMIFINSSWR